MGMDFIKIPLPCGLRLDLVLFRTRKSVDGNTRPEAQTRELMDGMIDGCDVRLWQVETLIQFVFVFGADRLRLCKTTK